MTTATTATYLAASHPDRVADSRLRKFRDDIQGIRGLAVLMVVIHHIGFSVYGGVDMSFVLSGYLATDGMLRGMAKQDAVSARWYIREFIPGYYARRVRRVIPLAALVIVATLAASYVLAPAYLLKGIIWDGVFAALSGQNYRLAMQGTDYFAHDITNTSPFQHFWSLGVEEQFYLVFPFVFLALFMLGARLKRARVILAIGFVLMFAGSLYLSVKLSPSGDTQPWAYFSSYTRAWEILIGCLVAVGARVFARMWLPLAAIMSWAGIATIAVGSVMVANSDAIPGSVMLWPTIGVGLFIAGGCANPWYGAELLFGTPEPKARIAATLARCVRFVPQALQYLGKVSYGWYLWHWAPLILLPYAVGRELNLLEKIGVVVGTLVLAIATNRFVERPIKANRELTQQPTKGLKLGYRFVVGALLAAGASAVVVGTTTAQPAQSSVAADPASIPGLVAESLQITKMPEEANTQLQTIKSDLYPGCIVGIKDTAATSCKLGDPNGTTNAVLLGSSLAWQWIPPLNTLAKDNGVRLTVFTKAGCPGEQYEIDALEGAKKGETYNECDPWRADAYRKIDALKPKLVILSSRVEPQATPQDITTAVDRFRKGGAKVVMLLETPHMGKDVPNCLSLHGGAVAKECSIALPKRPQMAMAAKAAQAAGATVIDPTPWLCAGGRCTTVIDDKVVYWDDHHLSATYSLWLTGAIGAQMPAPLNSK